MNQLQVNEKVLSYKFLSTVIYQNLTNLLLSRRGWATAAPYI